jgi:hypothetical protein
MIEYVHLPEDEEIQAAAGAYRANEEILDYKGKDILYVRSEAQGPVISCCGNGCLTAGSIFVKGRVVEWKTRNYKDELISRLEAIEDTKEQQEIKEIIEAKYETANIYF